MTSLLLCIRICGKLISFVLVSHSDRPKVVCKSNHLASLLSNNNIHDGIVLPDLPLGSGRLDKLHSRILQHSGDSCGHFCGQR